MTHNMKLTLTTYDSIVCTVTRMSIIENAIEFVNQLGTAVRLFADAIGKDERSIAWREVQDSDWCKGRIVLYCCVGHKWQPTPETLILDEWSNDGYYSRSFYDHIKHSTGFFTDTRKHPPTNPHKLYHSK